jgi:uncharacterized protein involved in exopolysaccharide biosynthesis
MLVGARSAASAIAAGPCAGGLAMTKPDARAQLEQLKDEHIKASNYAAEMLRKYGEDSPQFADADRIAAEITTRIEKLEQARASKSK